MNVSQESQGLSVTGRGKPQTLEEKRWHEAPIPLVAGKKKEKKEKGLHWTCFLNFRLSQKTEQNRPGSTLKKREWRWNMSI